MNAATSRVVVAGCALLLGCLAASVLTAHPDVELQIRDLTARIAREPQNPTLWMQRGELNRIHRSWAEAESDYRHARKIQPDLEVVDFLLGRMKLDAGQPKQAKKYLDRFLAAQPGHAKALVQRGRALVRLGQPLAAAGDYTQALEAFDRNDDRPDPSYYLDRARALVEAGPQHTETALRGIDEGLERWGRVITLQLYALELETKLGRHAAALARLERIAASANRQETWLVRRGEIYESAGQTDAARAAYAAALEAIEALPVSRRSSRAMQELGQQARAALEKLNGDPAAQGP